MILQVDYLLTANFVLGDKTDCRSKLPSWFEGKKTARLWTREFSQPENRTLLRKVKSRLG